MTDRWAGNLPELPPGKNGERNYVCPARCGIVSSEEHPIMAHLRAHPECVAKAGALSEQEPKPPTPTPAPRIALVDGDTTTPLSADALVVALFATELVMVRNQHTGHLIGVAFDRDKITTMAVQMQAVLDQGQSIGLQKDRIVKPTNGGGMVGP